MLDWLLDGSGQVGTPCERMQWEKATSFECAAPPAPGEPPEPVDEPVDDGPLPHAAASRATVAVAMMAAAVRAGRARRGRRMTRVLWFIMPSFGAGPWLRPAAGAHPD